MMNFLCPDTLIQSRARVRARASAVKMPVGAMASHTKDFKNWSGPCLHGALPCRAPVRSPYSVCTAYPTLFPSLEPSVKMGI